MNCIFCKNKSDSSTSVEHIIPESLGNADHVLPRGWVCDACNNYLSRKVEAPFMNSEYGKRVRFEMKIHSRRGRIPVIQGFYPQSRCIVDIMFDNDGLSLSASHKEDEIRFIHSLRSQERGSLYIPYSGEPNLDYETARFIGKVGLEVLAHRRFRIKGWNREIVNKRELDELRSYVRRGKPGFVWPIHIRRIYPADNQFDDTNETYQVLNEWTILFIPTQKQSNTGEYYAVIAILGVEYTINLGGPELDGYLCWLKENNNQSYLYRRKR